MKDSMEMLYQINTNPCIVRVPKMPIIMIDGHGTSNTNPDFYQSLEILIELSKILRQDENPKEKNFTAPIEMFWWMKHEHFSSETIIHKDQFYWTAIIRQPPYVNYHSITKAKKILSQKRPDDNISAIKYKLFDEGICAQITHIGPLHKETETINKLHEFVKEQGYHVDLDAYRKHHEIYLKKDGKDLTMIIRHPLRKPKQREQHTKV